MLGDHPMQRPRRRVEVVESGVLSGRRDGATFDVETDLVRLNKQMRRVYEVFKDGRWHTLYEAHDELGDPPQSISARLRDFRKLRFGSHTVERINRKGTHYYRLEWNESVPKP